MKIFFILAISILPYFFTPSDAKAAPAPDCIWWRMIRQERMRDDGISISYELVPPEENAALGDVEVVFISHRRSPEGNAEPPVVFAKKILEAEGAYTLDIYSGRYERIEILARARAGGGWQYAKTLTNGYGQSGRDDPSAERIPAVPDWPSLRIAGESYFYRQQTGQMIRLEGASGAETVDVFEDGVFARGMTGDSDGHCDYVPPHDAALSRQGYSAKKDLVFVADMKHSGEKRSLSLPLYRAYYGQIDLRSGLAVLVAAALLSLGAVLRAGMRFRWR
jgi:hypothetical protein